ncbi:MAG: hypothetical protein JXQ29_07490 [Planctomycetes bacterium]|nr:hypothetical protein [Planctomycetota bacterium]
MRIAGCMGLVLALLGTVSAQTVIYGPSTTRSFLTPMSGPQIIVRDSQANLYVIYRYQVSSIQSDIAIARSTTGGATWNLQWQTGFAYSTATDYGNFGGCIAIDSQDNLHCAWFHQVATSGSRIPRTTRYNRFDAATAKWGTEWVVTPTAAYEQEYPCLDVDQKDHVWFSYGPSGWKSYVDRSDLPCAPDLKFTRYTPAFASSASSQKVSMVVDAANRIHMTYYENGGTGGASIKHQWVDPAATAPAWTFQPLSNHSGNTARADYYSKMAADGAGNVYVIYVVDDQPVTTYTTDTEFFVRKWDGMTQTWGNPVLVHRVSHAVWYAGGKYNDSRLMSGACDETTGEFYFVYRDFGTGDFLIGRWRGIDTEPPTIYAKLMNAAPLPPTTQNYFFLPHFRGSIYPKQNRTSHGLDLLYVVGDQSAASPVYTDYFEHFPLASIASVRAPQIGTSYPLDLSAVAEGGKVHGTALTTSRLMPLLKIDRRYIPLAPDALFWLTVGNQAPGIFSNFHGVLGASGTAQAKIAIPAVLGLVGVQVDACFVTYDGGGVRAISNPWGFSITK